DAAEAVAQRGLLRRAARVVAHQRKDRVVAPVACGVMLPDLLGAEQREKRVAHPEPTIQVKARALSRRISPPPASSRAQRSDLRPKARHRGEIASLRSQ